MPAVVSGQTGRTDQKLGWKAYGAIMTLAFDMGSSLPLMVAGTLLRLSSSWRERTSGLSSYQLPAWVASRVPDSDMAPLMEWAPVQTNEEKWRRTRKSRDPLVTAARGALGQLPRAA